MDYTWDLSPLYEGFDTDAFRADLAALDAVMESVNTFAAEPAAAETSTNDATHSCTVILTCMSRQIPLRQS